MSVTVALMVASKSTALPLLSELECWVNAAVVNQEREAEVSIRLIDEEESASLNSVWRDRQGPTNVLSFPADLPEGIPIALLGDLAVCAPVVEKEAKEQGKLLKAHWAHIIIHGTLHLLGYDHIDENEAVEMETFETHIMSKLGYPDPYQNDTGILK